MRGMELIYKPLYEKYFDSAVIYETRKFLEIGVAWGNSLIYWDKYFRKPGLNICGIDWGVPHDEAEYKKRRVRYANLSKEFESINIYIGDQSKKEDIDGFIKAYHEGVDFDIIIDDGSHILKDQQLTLYWLINYLRVGGIYVIEDIHTSDPKHHSSAHNGLKKDLSNSTIKMVELFKETGKLESVYFNGGEIQDKLEVMYSDNSIVFFKRVK